tara:strand:- start:57 stop:278 length:222 start_codon:yes stop_codon:yes gene_type:complete
MAELTEQQVHLQQVLEQQQQLSQEAQQLNVAIQNNNAMFTKLQGVREYLEQTGVTLPQPEASAEAPDTEAADS